MQRLLAILLTLATASAAQADVTLSPIIDSQMVLQRGVVAPVWGWADEGETVTVTFAGQAKTAIASGDAQVALNAQVGNNNLQTLLQSAITSGDSAVANAAQAANDALETLLEAAIASGDSAVAAAAQAANDTLQTLLETAIADGDADTLADANAYTNSVSTALTLLLGRLGAQQPPRSLC